MYVSQNIGYVNTAVSIDYETIDDRLKCLRVGADLHRGVREALYKDDFLKNLPTAAAQNQSNPNSIAGTTEAIIQRAESALYRLVKDKNLNKPGSGFKVRHAFPTGVNLNEVAAHDSRTPGLGVTQYLRPRDVVKLDYGIAVNDYILDSAFTFTWDNTYDNLLDGVKDSVYSAISEAGPDALVDDLSAVIQEVMESYEVELPNISSGGPSRSLPVKSVQNLSGHLIERGAIHAGKQLPPVDSGSNQRMYEGEQWAVECFGSVNGLGIVSNLSGTLGFLNSSPCTHYMRPTKPMVGAFGVSSEQIVRERCSPEALSLYKFVGCEFGTLAFCPRWIRTPPSSVLLPTDFSNLKLAEKFSTQTYFSTKSSSNTVLQLGGGSKAYYKENAYTCMSKVQKLLSELSAYGAVNEYPPLVEKYGAIVAQYEHTILLKGSGKEVLTRGMDY